MEREPSWPTFGDAKPASRETEVTASRRPIVLRNRADYSVCGCRVWVGARRQVGSRTSSRRMTLSLRRLARDCRVHGNSAALLAQPTDCRPSRGLTFHPGRLQP